MRELSPNEFERVASLAQQRWGLALTARKMALVANRLASFLRKSQYESIDDYLHHIEHNGSEEDMLVFFDILSTNVTSFFRDAAHFEYLEREVYTPLARGNLTRPDRQLRLWSAGCSIGCEPYSLAINALESLAETSAEWTVRILATDLSISAVEQARRGEYPLKQVEHLPADVRQRHLCRSSDGQTVSVGSHLKQMVNVARLNLMEAWPMRGPFDVIFCRNVMIYFDAPTRRKLVNRFYDMLRPGGVFAVGSAETLSGLDTPFTAVQASVYRK